MGVLRAQGGSPPSSSGILVGSLSAYFAPAGAEVTIAGRGFPDRADLHVYFGGVEATVLEAGPTLITVRVPAGSTYAHPLIVDTSRGVSGTTPHAFQLSYRGEEAPVCDPMTDFPAFRAHGYAPPTGEPDVPLYDVCICDFDGDGRLDAAAAQSDVQDAENNQPVNNIALYTNTTPPISSGRLGDFTMDAGILGIGSSAVNIICADLDLDGRKDIIATQSLRPGGTVGFRLYYARNTTPDGGTLGFASPQELSLPRRADNNIRNIRRVAAGDLDGDGKPELVVVNQTDSVVFVYRNTSTSSGIVFASDPILLIANSERSGGMLGVLVEDWDRDGLSDILVSDSFRENFYIFRNQSRAGNISFLSPQRLGPSLLGGFYNVVAGDFDNDGDSDMAFTILTPQRSWVSVYINESVKGSIVFASSPISVEVTDPWGLDVGDMDGDEFLDIVVSSLENEGPVILTNNGMSGSALDFTARFLLRWEVLAIYV